MEVLDMVLIAFIVPLVICVGVLGWHLSRTKRNHALGDYYIKQELGYHREDTATVWVLKRYNAKRSTRRFTFLTDAIEYGKVLARVRRTKLTILDIDGKIAETFNYTLDN